MKIAGRLGILIGIGLLGMTGAPSVLAHEENCDVKGLVTNKKFKHLPQNAILKIQLIEAALADVDSPVIVGGDIDVSGQHFPLKFNMNLDCDTLKRTIMPSFNIRVEQDEKLLFINDTMHPLSHDGSLQKIELKKIN